MLAVTFRWALYQVDLSHRLFEIEVEPPMTAEHLIIKLIFNRIPIPNGVSLKSTLGVGVERWTVQWDRGEFWTMLASLNSRFQNFVVNSTEYGAGWRARARRDRITRQLREIEQLVWWSFPQERFGGRSTNELWELKNGAYEIIGQGFLWLGEDGTRGRKLEFHSLVDDEQLNQDLRWYLERGTSVSEAVALRTRRWNRIAAQTIVAFAVMFAEQSVIESGAASLEELAELSSKALSSVTPLPSHEKAFDAVVEHLASHPDERKIQRLNQTMAVPITKLAPK
jgi:hypothetical protein